MKVNFCDEAINGVNVSTLGIGKTFCDHRRSNPDQIALYMIVDGNNSYVNRSKLNNISSYLFNTLAINLATGQLKAYRPDDKVFPVDIEINVPRF